MRNEDVQEILDKATYPRGPKAAKTKYTAVRVLPGDLEVLEAFAQEHECDLAVLFRAGAMHLINQAKQDPRFGGVS